MKGTSNIYKNNYRVNKDKYLSTEKFIDKVAEFVRLGFNEVNVILSPKF